MSAVLKDTPQLIVDRMLLAFTVHANRSYGDIARQLNKARIEPPFGAKWTEAHVAGEIGRMIQERTLEAVR